MENILSAWQSYKASNESQFVSHKNFDQASSSFFTQGFPKGEDWRYVSFANLKKRSLVWPKSSGKNQIEELNDRYVLKLQNFSEAFEALDTSAIKGMKIDVSGSDDPCENFTDLNSWFPGRQLMIAFGAEYDSSKPLYIEINIDNEELRTAFCPVSLVFKSQSTPKVFVETKGDGFEGFLSLDLATQVNEGCRLGLYLQEGLSAESHAMVNIKADVAKDATFSCFDNTNPGLWSRHNLRVNLNDKHAKASLKGVYLNQDSHFVDHHTEIHHKVGQTFSEQDYRGVLGDQSKAVFNGKIQMDENASGSNSELINKNLMLSKKAEIDTKPELQIYNDDVKAAHGATVGQLDEEQRFYLQSRGYSAKQAGQILAKAFVFGLLDNEDQSVKDFFGPQLTHSLSQMKEL